MAVNADVYRIRDGEETLIATDVAPPYDAGLDRVQHGDTLKVEKQDGTQRIEVQEPNVLTDLVAFYPMHEPSDGTSAVVREDAHKYELDLRDADSLPSQSGPRGERASVDGGGLKVDSGFFTPGDGGFGIGGFMKVPSGTSINSDAYIATQDNNNDGQWKLQLINVSSTEGSFRFSWKTTSGYVSVDANSYGNYTYGTDVYVAASRNRNGDISIYVTEDGTNWNVDTNAGVAADTDYDGVFDLSFGESSLSGGGLDGLLDEWAYLRSEPSQSDWEWLCNSMSGRSYDEFKTEETNPDLSLPTVKLQEKYFFSSDQPGEFASEFPDWPAVSDGAKKYPWRVLKTEVNHGYWFKPYKLRDLGTEGTNIADSTGYEYVWFESVDHGSSNGIYMGFSNSPGTAPDQWTYVWEIDTEGMSGVYTQTETPYLVHNPDDADGRPFYLYYHTCTQSACFDQDTFLITSDDLQTWTDEGQQFDESGNTSYTVVWRRGSGDFVAHNLGGWYTSTAQSPKSQSDWTKQDVNGSLNFNGTFGMELGFRTQRETKSPVVTLEDGRKVQAVRFENLGGVYENLDGVVIHEVNGPIYEQVSLADSHDHYAGNSRRLITRAAKFAEGDPNQCQDVLAYEEDGVYHIYPKWGFKTPSYIEHHTFVYDKSLAKTAVPVGLDVAIGDQKLEVSVKDALPHQQYTFEIAEDSGFTTGVQTQDVEGTSHTFTGLTNGTTYYVRAQSRYDNNTSSYTPNETATPETLSFNTVEAHAGTGMIEVNVEVDDEAVVTVDYGTATNYGSTKESREARKSHRILLDGLNEGQTYHVRARAERPDGISDEAVSADQTVTTLNSDLVLNQTSNVYSAWSLNRKLGPDHDYAMIVTDQAATETTYQIGFSGGDVDESALLNPGVDLWVKEIRDATTSRRDLVQTDQSLQGKIVENGAIKRGPDGSIIAENGIYGFDHPAVDHTSAYIMAAGYKGRAYDDDKYHLNFNEGNYNARLDTGDDSWLETNGGVFKQGFLNVSGKEKFYLREAEETTVLGVHLLDGTTGRFRANGAAYHEDEYSTNGSTRGALFSKSETGNTGNPWGSIDGGLSEFIILENNTKAQEAAARLNASNYYSANTRGSLFVDRPEITSSASTTVTENTTYTYTVTANDLQNRDLKIVFASDFPKGAEITDNGDGTADITWDAPAHTGTDDTYDFKVSAFNDYKFTTQSWTVTVQQA
jgi:hypothetical protein